MSERKDDKRGDADATEKPVSDGAAAVKPVVAGAPPIDELSLQSHRRAIAYGRARGNA